MGRLDRMLADLDAEIAETEHRLIKLKEARRALSPSSPRRTARATAPSTTDSPAPPSATTTTTTKSVPERVREILADGREWSVDDVESQIGDSRHSILVALSRGARGDNPVFERVRHGVYKRRAA